jgi:uncharacterized RDD family membrane protein YckC
MNTAGRRVLASVGDFGVIVGWLAGLTAVSVVVRTAVRGSAGDGPDIWDSRDAPPAAVDLGVFLLTVLPVGAYLTATEAGPHQASAGKRRQGLRVTTIRGARPGPRRVLARNALKLLPWQLGHLSATRFATGREPSPAVWAAYGLALALAVADVAAALRDPHGRALHDRLTGTRVTPT